MAKYYAPLGAQSVTNDSSQDLWVIASPADAAVKLLWAKMSSTVTSDERLLLSLIQRSGAGSATVGTTVTPLVTTQGTGTKIFVTDYWSQLTAWEWMPTPECCIIIPPSTYLALALGTAVASTRTMTGYVCFEEIG